MNIIELFKEIVLDDSYDSDYTLEDAEMLINDAKNRGFKIPAKLTPQLYIKMYNASKKTRTKEYLMEICKERVEDCLCDGIETEEDAKEYLTKLKLNGYSVPSLLTPKLFLKLQKELDEQEGW